jgi:ribonuclease HII
MKSRSPGKKSDEPVFRCVLAFEKRLRKTGLNRIAGADEVGRGALAGPVVGAAVILNLDDVPDGIDDSKKLTRRARERLADEIKQRAVAYAIARIENSEIDRINILQASLLAMAQAAKALQPPPEYVLIDGRYLLPGVECPQRAIVKGDKRCKSIAAASILAKVARDHWMRDLDELYPGYGFASHVGYNTRVHQQALAKLGASAVHRVTFQGVLSFQPLLDFGS